MSCPKPLPPLETLRQVFSYDPETGALTWRVAPGNGLPAGAPAGNPKGDGYTQVQLGSHRLRAHRVAWYMHHGADPGPLLVDHINRNRSDNRASNLRLVDDAGNSANSALLRPVQITYPDGQTRLFPSVLAAAAALGCHKKSIYRYSRGLSQHPAGLLVSYT
jgi:hypothetical protein